MENNSYLNTLAERLKNNEKAINELEKINIDIELSTIELIEAVSKKWNDLNGDEKLKIATSIGGVYNLNKTLSLFNNYEVNA